MSTRWITDQLVALATKRTDQPPAAPRVARPAGSVIDAGSAPLGVMRHGSATHAVYVYLADRRKRYAGWTSRHQIVTAVSRHHKAVDWALIYLRTVKLIETSQDPRCSRYLRYRAIR